jgi:hypothetical protein
VEAAIASEVEQFSSLTRGRLATEGWQSAEWVEAGLREALLKDGWRLLDECIDDPALPLVGDASGPGEKCTREVERQVGWVFGVLRLRRNYYYRLATRTAPSPVRD